MPMITGLTFATESELQRLEDNARYWIVRDELEYFSPQELQQRRRFHRRTLLRVLWERDRRKKAGTDYE